MENHTSIKNKSLRLPPGFRFHPTDQELLVQYLHRKVTGLPLPPFIIPETDICKSDPWELPGDCDSERYFFSTRESKYPNGNRSNRATGSGYWKATGIDKQIVGLRGEKVVGMKKTLVFYKGKPPNGTRTDWVLHEYRLADSQQLEITFKDSISNMNWVLCRVFLKKRNSIKKKEEEEDEDDKNCPIFYDFLKKNEREKRGFRDLNLIHTSCSSSSSSVVTQTSSNDFFDEHDQEISCPENKFSLFL